MQFLDNVLVIGGGDLGYIIMIATAGECAMVFALDVRQGVQLQPLVEQFEVRFDYIFYFGCLAHLVRTTARLVKFIQHHDLTAEAGADEEFVRQAKGIASLHQSYPLAPHCARAALAPPTPSCKTDEALFPVIAI